MADQIKITKLTDDPTPLATDVIPLVDITDHTQSASGTTKKMSKANFVKSMANVGITSGTINNTVLGNLVPCTGFFDELDWLIGGSHFSTNQVVDPAASLTKIFQMDTAGTEVLADPIGDYDTGFQFYILNTSNGNVTFLPTSPDLINGQASLIIPANSAVLIIKNLATSPQWSTLSDNASNGALPFLVSNNLSESANFTTLRNNIGANLGYQAITLTGLTVLTNPCPVWVDTVPSLGNNITAQLPAMNVTTPGAKSIQLGEGIRVRNAGSAGVTTITHQDASAFFILQAGQFVDLVLRDNGSANGIFETIRFGTASQMDASDTSSTSRLAAALNPTSGFDGKIPVFSGGDGSLVSSGAELPTGAAEVISGDGANSVIKTITAGTGMAIDTATNPGEIILISTGGGLGFVPLDIATSLTMAPDTIYSINNAGTNLLTLPSNPTPGATFSVQTIAGCTGNFEIRQGDATQHCKWLTAATTIGTSGKIVSNDDFNCLQLTTEISDGLDTLFSVTGNQGINFTFV